MNKIFDYVKNNRGIGALILLTLALVYSIYYTIVTSNLIDYSIPYVQNGINEIAPLKIENGKVVVPADTYKKVKLVKEAPNSPYVVIDTTTDVMDVRGKPVGIYLTRSNLYTITPSQTRVRELVGSFELEQKDYTEVMEASVKWIALGILVGFTISLFVMYMLLMLFYSLVIKIAEAVTGKKLSFDESMRLNTVLFTGVSLVCFILGLIGINIGNLVFFVAMIVLQIFAVNGYKK